MIDVEKYDNELYKSIYGNPRVGNYDEIWNKIKSNSELLREAVKVIRDKFDENDIVKGLTICDSMLLNYESVDEVAYNNLINSIYTNIDIARIVMDGASNGGYSFLLMSLWNHNLKLSDKQKAFAVNEAMNKIGTTRWKKSEEEFSKKLDDMGINDDNTTTINIDGCVNPIGQKSSSEYMNYLFSTISKTQAHGTGEFDIRYHILRNPNWTLEEKRKLIMDFWCDDETYEEFLEQWEWSVANDLACYVNDVCLFDKSYLYEYTYDELLMFCKDRKTTNKIWDEIEFCKQMHQLRFKQWELEFIPKKKVLQKDEITKR